MYDNGGWTERPTWNDIANGLRPPRPPDPMEDPLTLGEWAHGWQFHASNALERAAHQRLLQELPAQQFRVNGRTPIPAASRTGHNMTEHQRHWHVVGMDACMDLVQYWATKLPTVILVGVRPATGGILSRIHSIRSGLITNGIIYKQIRFRLLQKRPRTIILQFALAATYSVNNIYSAEYHILL